MQALTNLTRLRLLFVFGVLLFPALFVACGDDDDDTDIDSPTSTNDSNDNGNDETVSVDTWTQGLCDSVVSWQADIEALASDIEFGDDDTDVDAVKDRLVAFFEDVDNRTRDFKDDIDDLGNPDIDDGDEIQAALSGAAGDVETIFSESRTEVEDLDTSDPAALAEQLTALGESLDAAGTEVADAFAQIDRDYDTTEINEAAEGIEECEGLF